jgi:hypothetical protein
MSGLQSIHRFLKDRLNRSLAKAHRLRTPPAGFTPAFFSCRPHRVRNGRGDAAAQLLRLDAWASFFVEFPGA